MSIVKGIKVGTTDITSIEVTPVSLAEIGSIASPEDTTYTGSEITPTPVVTANFDGFVVTLDYGIDYVLTYSNNVNVGIATVTATGIGNYTGSISSYWSITSSDLVVVANDQEYMYDGAYHGNPITASAGGGETVTIRYGLSAGSYEYSSAPQIRNVSESRIVYFKVSAPNYSDYLGTYRLDINQRVAELTWGTSTWKYDGESHSTTCIVTNRVTGDLCDVILSGNTITGNGLSTVTSTVTVTGLSNPNYALPLNVTYTLTVNPGLVIKILGEWIPVKKVFKKLSGIWVQQEASSAFSTAEKYVKKN